MRRAAKDRLKTTARLLKALRIGLWRHGFTAWPGRDGDARTMLVGAKGL